MTSQNFEPSSPHEQRERHEQPELHHEHRNHSVLAASAAERWLNCTPSARLEENFPSTTTSYAEKGTFMHEVCEYKLRHNYFHEMMEKPISDRWDETEVEQITDVYYDFVVSVVEELKKTCEPLVLIEERLNYSHIAPSGFGTGDLVIVGKDAVGKDAESQGVIHVIDFKSGRGVFVDANNNPQMMLYALGALNAYGYLFDIKVIRMTIVQPILDNISTFECSCEELEAWGESIKPIAKLAYEGKGEQKTGDWCRFCRAKVACKACADEALALCREEFADLDASENASDEPVFKRPSAVPINDLIAVLPSLNRISAWIKDVFAYVSARAINDGIDIPGFKVIEGQSRRVFTDEEAVEKTALENGYTDIYKKQLIGLTEFEKLLGKKQFTALLGKYVQKPQGKLSLVPESDSRRAVAVKNKNTPNQEFDVLPDSEE